ncbi:conserved effector locus protein [Pseudomonas amygdali pv. morsprunorum]|nr:conserved effector locus protein [Pseudomonas amygdali pv. morsprunorum]
MNERGISMRPVEAKDRLYQWLRNRGIDAQEGQRHNVRTANGSECLLWLPEQDTSLFIFTQIERLTMPQDNVILILAMALNLEPARTGGAALGYNPDSRELLLRSVHSMADLDETGLDHLMTRISTLAVSLQRYLEDYRRQEQAGKTAQKEPRFLPAVHLTPRTFMT